MPMLYLYIHSKSNNDSIKEIYRSVYDHMIEIIIQQDNPVKSISYSSLSLHSSSSNFMAFLQTHFASDFSSDLELSRELIENNVVNAMVILLNKLAQTTSVISVELSKEEVRNCNNPLADGFDDSTLNWNAFLF